MHNNLILGGADVKIEHGCWQGDMDNSMGTESVPDIKHDRFIGSAAHHLFGIHEPNYKTAIKSY